MKKILVSVTLATVLAASAAQAFPNMDPAKACSDCHKLSVQEATDLLIGMVDRVLAVDESEVPGLWVVDIERGNQKGPVYLDFSKKYLLSGSLLDLKERKDLTRERMIELNRVDVSSIPLEDAVVIGDPGAKHKIIVFDDPECPYCQKIHPEMKKVVEERPDVAFFIKMLPLKIHPDARRKAKTIVCTKSAQMLEDSLAGKAIPDPECETDAIEKNEALAPTLGIRSTPTLVYPDGRVVPGYKTAEQILAELSKGGKSN